MGFLSPLCYPRFARRLNFWNTKMNDSSTSLQLVNVNGEPRIRDIDLGVRLGFADPRMVRKLIKSHRENLNKISQVYAVEHRPENGGRVFDEFYLDQKQAIFICMKSETAKAVEVQMEVVHVYDAYLKGERASTAVVPQLSPDPIINALMFSLQEIGQIKAQQARQEQALTNLSRATQDTTQKFEQRIRRLEVIAKTQRTAPVRISPTSREISLRALEMFGDLLMPESKLEFDLSTDER